MAWNDPPLSFNNNTNRGNAIANNNPLYLMDAGGFSYYDADLNYINNDQFGTCTIDSLDPLTITYTDQRGRHVVRRRAGRRRRHAAVLGRARAVCSTTPNTVDHRRRRDRRRPTRTATPIVVGPDGADITSVDEAAYAAAFDPRDGRAARGLHLQGVDGRRRSTRSSESLQLITAVPGDLRGRPGR